MKKPLFLTLAGLTFGTALCGSAALLAQPAKDAPASAGTNAAAVTTAAAKPRYGSFGFDETGMDKSVKPGDDFYAYANGTWARTTVIPADKSNYGMFNVLDDLSKDRTRAIIEGAAKDPDSKIGRAYASFMDEAGVEARGLTPFKPWLGQIAALRDKAGYAALAAQAKRNGIPGLFGAAVGQDDKNPDVYVLNLYQSGLGMPDRDYYLKPDASFAKTRDAYVAHIAKMLTLAGEPDADARAKALMAFETEIAKVSWTRIDSRDATRTYNKVTLADLQKSAPGFDFGTFFKGFGATGDSLIVAQPSAVTGIARLVAATPLATLKDAMLVRSLDQYADYLPKAFVDENFAFYGTVLSGTPELEPRWKRGVTFVTDSLSDEVSRQYVAQYFPPETKAAAEELVHNIIAAMGRRIDQLAWMSAQAKAKAHQKLAAFTPKIGYPSQWRDFSGLEVKGDDLLGNAMRSSRFETDYNIGHLGKPIYRWEWGMTPMEINAYANFGMVEIVFPAAILQPPFFDPKADPAINYGGIGAVIGHELSHHFDDQGAKYDASGKLTDWWTPQDVANFQKLTGELAAQYDRYEPLPGEHVQGKLTLGENIADLAGLTLAYDAYKASLDGKPAPVIDGTTGDQRFYLGWAQVWRRNYREANLRQRLLTDPHSPSQQRVATVRNLDPWYGAYKPAPTDKIYLKPEDRVRIW